MSGPDSSMNNYGYQTDYAAQAQLVSTWHHSGEKGNPLFYSDNSAVHTSWTDDPNKVDMGQRLAGDDIDKVNKRIMAQSDTAADLAADSWAKMQTVLSGMRDTYAKQTDAILNGSGSYGQWQSKAASAFAAKGPGAAMKSLDDWAAAATANQSGLKQLAGVIRDYQQQMRTLYAQYQAALHAAEQEWNKYWSQFHDTRDQVTGPKLQSQSKWNRDQFIDMMKQVRDGAVKWDVNDVLSGRIIGATGNINWSAKAFALEYQMATEYTGAISNLFSARAERYEGPTDAVTVDQKTFNKAINDYIARNLPHPGGLPNPNGLTSLSNQVPVVPIPGNGKPPGSQPDPGSAPDPGKAPDPGGAPDPGPAPDPGAAPDPGSAPNPGSAPDPGAAPDPGSAPGPGAVPDPAALPNPGLAPSLAGGPAAPGLSTGVPSGPGAPGGLPAGGLPASPAGLGSGLPPGLPGGLASKPPLPRGLISRGAARPNQNAPGTPGPGSPQTPGVPGLGSNAPGRNGRGNAGVRRGVLGRPDGATPDPTDSEPAGARTPPGLPGSGSLPPGLPRGAARTTTTTPPGSVAPGAPVDDLAAGAAPPSAPPVLGAARRPDVPTFARAGQPVPQAGTGQPGTPPDGAGPSVLHAPRPGTTPGTAAPGLPPGFPPGGPGADRRRGGPERPGYVLPDQPGDWVTAAGPDGPQPTTSVIDGSARAARIQSQPVQPAAPALPGGAGSGVLGRPVARGSAPVQQSTRRRGEPERVARRLTSPHDGQQPQLVEEAPAVVTDEHAFTVANPGGSVLANAPRPEPERGLG